MEILHLDANGNPMPVFSPNTKTANATIKVNGTAASAATAAVISATERTTVRLWADADCHIAIDATPTATTSDIPLSSGVETFMAIEPACKIAVLGANLYITKHKA